MAEEADVSLRWRPFLLGPIFAAQGMTTSPFVLYPSKGAICGGTRPQGPPQGITMMKPENFPQNSLAAARLALAGRDEGWTPAFSKALFRAQFCEGRNIADEPVLSSALKLAGAEPGRRDPAGAQRRHQGPPEGGDRNASRSASSVPPSS